MSTTAEGAVASSGRASNRTVRTAVRRGGGAADSAGDAARWQRSHWAGPSSPSSAGAGMLELDGQEPQANGSTSGRSVAGCECGNPASSQAAAATASHSRCARAVYTSVQLRLASVLCQDLPARRFGRRAPRRHSRLGNVGRGVATRRRNPSEHNLDARRGHREDVRAVFARDPRRRENECGARSSPTAGTAALTERQKSGEIHPLNARGRYARQTQLRVGTVCA